MARRMSLAVVGSAVALLLGGSADAVAVRANPIRKVVNLLQQMQNKVKAEGEKEKELYEKFECWCKNGDKDLADSIAAAEDKIETLTADIKASTEKKAKLESEVKEHKADREAAIKAMSQAKAIREKEAEVYAQLKAEYGANSAAFKKAIAAIERGVGGAFVQTYAADVLRSFVKRSTEAASEEDRDTLLAFLSDSSKYAPQSGQILGIMKTMQDEMNAAYKEATETEEAAIKAFDALMMDKTEEKTLASAAIEKKTEEVAELGISIAEMENDLEDTEQALAEDKKFASNLEETCAKKKVEWEEREKLRGEELVALADTIKILNDDESLELFKKTLPSAGASSFVQVQVTAASTRARATALLKQGLKLANKADRPRYDAIFLALHGKKIGFEKVLAMIDEMTASLQKEQEDDDAKKEYCVTTMDTSDDKKKQLERKKSDLEKAIAVAEETIKTLSEEVASLTAGIKALDATVAEATANRKEEHTEYKDLMASNNAAKEVLLFAKNRLNKFYNPAQYKAPAKEELSEGDRIAANMGGAAALAQVSLHGKAAPPPPPETFGAYQKKDEENNGVMAMLGLLVKELDKEMTVAETEEKNAQEDYEILMQDSAEKRAADSKSITEKEAAKADTEAALQQHEDDHASTSKELAATLQFIASLHAECDWILKYHSVRQEARASEIDALGKAKAVLSGADYSLLQLPGARNILRRRSA